MSSEYYKQLSITDVLNYKPAIFKPIEKGEDKELKQTKIEDFFISKHREITTKDSFFYEETYLKQTTIKDFFSRQ